MKEAEKITEGFFQEKKYEEIEVYSCKPRRGGGYKVLVN